MKEERFFPNGPRKLSGSLRKTVAKERGILMPLVKDIIGRDVYDHLTGSGAQSLRCLLPIFDPDGVG